MPASPPPPHRTSVGWTRTPDAHWQRVLLDRGTGARLTAAALAVFPGACVHRVVTDVLGTSEVHLVTAEGRHLVVRQEPTDEPAARAG